MIRRDTPLSHTVSCDCCGTSVQMPSPVELPAGWATVRIDQMTDAGLVPARLDLCPDHRPPIVSAINGVAAAIRRAAA